MPDRFRFGYGLTPEIVEVAAGRQPDLLVTVDNGTSSVAGVDAANARGIAVIVTDHHLAGAELPRAAALVNPNQPGEPFPSKCLAGVGVMFYLLVALRRALRLREWFERKAVPVPRLADLLDLVAVGTLADVVPLDRNNRILVSQGWPGSGPDAAAPESTPSCGSRAGTAPAPPRRTSALRSHRVSTRPAPRGHVARHRMPARAGRRRSLASGPGGSTS